jgi:hypothetical protein
MTEGIGDCLNARDGSEWQPSGERIPAQNGPTTCFYDDKLDYSTAAGNTSSFADGSESIITHYQSCIN